MCCNRQQSMKFGSGCHSWKHHHGFGNGGGRQGNGNCRQQDPMVMGNATRCRRGMQNGMIPCQRRGLGMMGGNCANRQMQFGNYLAGITGRGSNMVPFMPRSDVFETFTHFTITMEVPGFSKNDISIEYEDIDGILKISGVKPPSNPESRTNPDQGVPLFNPIADRNGPITFERNFRLGNLADPEQIMAELVDGVLTVKIAKVSRQPNEKLKININ